VTQRQIRRGLRDVVIASPRFATAPLVRSWHLRWGATSAEVAAPMAAKVNETTAFRIKGFATDEWLLWEKPASTWSWKLTPLEGGRTRLITRLKQHNDWDSPAMALVTVILFEFGDFPMMRRLLLGVKARAEAPGTDRIAS